MNKQLLIILLFLSLSNTSFYQELEEGHYAIDYDSTYIQDYRQRVFTFGIVRVSNFFIAVFRENQDFLQFTSNLPKPTYGVNFSYKWINFAVSLAIPKLSITNTNYPESEGIPLSFRPTLRKFYFSTFFEEYKGYRLLNTDLQNSGFD